MALARVGAENQLPPASFTAGEHRVWLIMAGRGFGKNRTAAETTRAEVEAGRRMSIGLISPTAETARRDMVKDILAVSPPHFMPIYEPSQRRVTWPNGAIGHTITSQEPERARGLNLDWIWGDELGSWDNPQETWSNASLTLRVAGPLGHPPQAIITTTPKRSLLLKTILADPGTVMTRGSTFDNIANLAPAAVAALKTQFGNSTLGRQELLGELIEDLEGALWNRAMFDKHRVKEAPPLRQIVVAVDPAGGSSKRSDETGIVAVGVAADKHIYVLRDASGRYSPEQWARRAVALHDELHADRIVCEANFGGEMVAATLKATGSTARIEMVTASRGKQIRAEPIVSLYEQGLVHHVGDFPQLEDQCCSWEPLEFSFSPDRLDALVWAATKLSGRSPLHFTAEDLAAITPVPGTDGWRRLHDPFGGGRW